MKHLIIFLVLIFILGFFSSAIAQDDVPTLKKVYLDQDDGLLAIPSQIVLIPGDSLQFYATNGDFAIFIENAVSFLKIKNADLKIQISSSETAESDIFIVREVDADISTNYSIYCISNNSWPAAPPRIIIVLQ
jgi:hypothetical protein